MATFKINCLRENSGFVLNDLSEMPIQFGTGKQSVYSLGDSVWLEGVLWAFSLRGSVMRVIVFVLGAALSTSSCRGATEATESSEASVRTQPTSANALADTVLIVKKDFKSGVYTHLEGNEVLVADSDGVMKQGSAFPIKKGTYIITRVAKVSSRNPGNNNNIIIYLKKAVAKSKNGNPEDMCNAANSVSETILLPRNFIGNTDSGANSDLPYIRRTLAGKSDDGEVFFQLGGSPSAAGFYSYKTDARYCRGD